MDENMAGSWRKLVGIALLWVALAVLFRLSQGGGAAEGPWMPLLGFACFAGGMSLFADGLKRSIVAAFLAAGRKPG